MSDIFAMIGAAFAALIAYWLGRKSSVKSEAMKRKAETLEEMNRIRKDVETQDDPALVDRLTRRDR